MYDAKADDVKTWLNLFSGLTTTDEKEVGIICCFQLVFFQFLTNAESIVFKPVLPKQRQYNYS